MVRSFVTDRLGLDFEKELLPALSGRLTYVTFIERPVTSIVSPANAGAMTSVDGDAFQAVLDKFVSKFSDRFEKKSSAA